MFDTIAAASTGPGLAALGVIRLSGPEAAAICDRLFKPNSRFPKPSLMPGYTMAYGSWRDLEGKELDQLVLAAFRAPHSYTGEDLFELSHHGGSQVRRSLLESLYAAGARPAEAGEFSKRAFLNGKMDLTEAEAVMDLIAAETERQQELALQEMSGSLAKAVASLRSSLINLLATLENTLEFSEENVEEADLTFLRQGLEKVLKQINLTLAGWRQGKVLADAFRVSILGLPNAGKSSLLNSILGESRAIVSDISGTTRDTLEARVQIAGLPILLTDTAGLRDSEDLIEREGVSRAKAAAGQADLVLWLHDPLQAEASLKAVAELRRELGTEVQLCEVVGKCDLPQAELLARSLKTGRYIYWSKEEPARLDDLREVIAKAYAELGPEHAGGVLIHNLRHKQLLDQAKVALDLALQSLADPQALDMTAAMIRNGLASISAISQAEISDQLVEEIFSRFCVGK
ncbi:MAG: tRNA uridine-5-carboxymethylaminomethyl(34) synthesis GTPase MnmE [Eubacteriales bacterium]|nr:tRNA uridine-5-carboxymethylaminomethyl(34) synthesis GTPase MnmE [Eubacteriales bacterium]